MAAPGCIKFGLPYSGSPVSNFNLFLSSRPDFLSENDPSTLEQVLDTQSET